LDIEPSFLLFIVGQKFCFTCSSFVLIFPLVEAQQPFSQHHNGSPFFGQSPQAPLLFPPNPYPHRPFVTRLVWELTYHRLLDHARFPSFVVCCRVMGLVPLLLGPGFSPFSRCRCGMYRDGGYLHCPHTGLAEETHSLSRSRWYLQDYLRKTPGGINLLMSPITETRLRSRYGFTRTLFFLLFGSLPFFFPDVLSPPPPLIRSRIPPLLTGLHRIVAFFWLPFVD